MAQNGEKNGDMSNSEPSLPPESIVFNTLELLSLYTVMMVKRFSRNLQLRNNYLPQFMKTIESNLSRLKVDKHWYFATVRDQVRLCHNQWQCIDDDTDIGMMHYNTHLIIVALRLGLENMWVPDGCLPLFEDTIVGELKNLYESGKPSFALKQLSQADPMFEFLMHHSPNLEKLFMPLSDNQSFQNCVKFSNLRMVELAGGVSDKVMCSALWNINNKKSDKVLEMALKDSKEPGTWHLSLPHLEVLRNNMLQCKAQVNAMRVSLGAVALAVQPKLKVVETLQSWDTYSAVVYLLDMEAKQRNKNGYSERTLAVTSLSVAYAEELNMDELRSVVKACPKLANLRLDHTENIHKELALICAIIPMKHVKNLSLDATNLTNRELTVLLAEMHNLEQLTLRLTLRAIINFNIPNEEDARVAMLPNIKILSIEFLYPDLELDTTNDNLDFESKDMMSFLSCFSLVKELYFYNTVLAPASYLVYGCIGGSLAVLHKLQHLSVISCHEDVPRELTHHPDNDNSKIYKHYSGVPRMLADLQDETTFKHLRALKTLTMDELYINSSIDRMIELLRLCGVMVAVHYRPGVHRYPYRAKGLTIVFPSHVPL